MKSLSFFQLALLVILLPSSAVFAAPQWTGPLRYEFVNQQTQVALSAELISNSSRENATGTLEVQLWAGTEPYQSGTIHGVLLGSAKLEGLAAGQVYKGLRRVVPYTPPTVRGNYYLTMLLLEFRGGTYVIVQHSSFTSPVNLGPLPLFTMEGPWRYQVSSEGGTVDMGVAKISHRRTGNTGSLKLAVWATATPYHGGALRGFEIAEVRKDALKPGFAYTNVANVGKYVKPPPGEYYMSLVLFESNGKEFEVVAHLESNGTAHF